MIGNLKDLTGAFNALVGEAKTAYAKIAPEAVNPEKRFVNAVALSCAYVTVADGKTEVSEITDMMRLIHSLKQIQDLELHDFATTVFKETVMHLDATAETKGSAALVFEKQHVLNDIRTVKHDEDYRDLLKNLLTVLKTNAGKNDPLEIQAMREILEVIE